MTSATVIHQINQFERKWKDERKGCARDQRQSTKAIDGPWHLGDCEIEGKSRREYLYCGASSTRENARFLCPTNFCYSRLQHDPLLPRPPNPNRRDFPPLRLHINSKMPPKKSAAGAKKSASSSSHATYRTFLALIQTHSLCDGSKLTRYRRGYDQGGCH